MHYSKDSQKSTQLSYPWNRHIYEEDIPLMKQIQCPDYTVVVTTLLDIVDNSLNQYNRISLKFIFSCAKPINNHTERD